ncbi:dimethylguanosine trna methyltransferase [Diaporthe amygdali]|uniref:dimethylguanosine trna methyltransferase n=1 Tax=Phomopsis amygdali TaxID=1214568 RepID=UPI0022FEDE61|nr:dimethylguanosine trna methyltransferase [Diaporthe amygdali]KAJ0123842.1 dimethylguanosine trna methyltransferase [Diaporthe amygdali]
MDSRSLRATPSQETLISLLQLEPQPMPDTDKDLPPLPEESSDGTRTEADTEKETARSIGVSGISGHARTSSLGLSGSGHGSIYYLTRIQRYSTYALSIFTGLHIANTSIIPLITRSVPASEGYLLLAREIYQTPLTEPLFVALPIAAHIASGIALRLVRRSQNLKRYGGATPAVLPTRSSTGRSTASSGSAGATSAWPPLTWVSASGYGFAAFLAAHVAMNRLLPLHIEGDSSNIGLAYVAHGFAAHPATSYVAYAGLLTLGCGHMVWGWAKWIGLAQLAGWRADIKTLGTTRDRNEDVRRRKRRRRIWLWINGTAVAATAVWAAGALGVVARGGRADGWVGKAYDELFAAVGLGH